MSAASGQMALNWQSLDVRLPVKAAMAQALKECGLARDQVVDRFNAFAARGGVNFRITIHVLEKWVAPSAEHFIPCQYLPVFCQAVDSLEPLSALAAPLGAVIAGPREQRLIAYAEADLKAKALAKAKRRAAEDLEGLL